MMKTDKTKQFELIERVLDILEKRATDETRTHETRIAYNSALTMLLYAIMENEECLNQFNY